MATESTVDGTELTLDLSEAFRQAGGLDDSPRTLEDGFRAVTERLNEAGITVTLEDMYQPEPTRHAVDVGDSVEHVPCVLDALIVANLPDEDHVEIRSESPANGETIHFRVSEDEVNVTPKHAVVSFGLGLEESADPDLDSVKDTFNDPDAPHPYHVFSYQRVPGFGSVRRMGCRRHRCCGDGARRRNGVRAVEAGGTVPRQRVTDLHAPLAAALGLAGNRYGPH